MGLGAAYRRNKISQNSVSNPSNGNTSAKAILGLMLVLFFMWGFITCLNDLLIPRLKLLFSLNYTQVMLVQFAFFGAYAVMSLPSSHIVGRLGYRMGAVIGLVIASCGCLMFIPSVYLHQYYVFLIGLFVLATGIVMLQVAANPCVTSLGDAKGASSRLTFAQGLNSFGTTIAPLLMGGVIVAGGVDSAYVGLAVALLICAVLILFFRGGYFKSLGKVRPKSAGSAENMSLVKKSAWSSTRLILGAIGIFVYVGAEVSTGSLLTNYIHLPQIANISLVKASHYLSFFWGGAMIGRFIGAWLMQMVRTQIAVIFNAIVACLLIVFSLLTHGSVAMWSILGLGLCNSIMFPCIFSLAIEGLGDLTSQGSGILCTAIVGGAILPVMQGWLADHIGLPHSFIIQIICYLYIAAFCWRCLQAPSS